MLILSGKIWNLSLWFQMLNKYVIYGNMTFEKSAVCRSNDLLSKACWMQIHESHLYRKPNVSNTNLWWKKSSLKTANIAIFAMYSWRGCAQFETALGVEPFASSLGHRWCRIPSTRASKEQNPQPWNALGIVSKPTMIKVLPSKEFKAKNCLGKHANFRIFLFLNAITGLFYIC